MHFFKSSVLNRKLTIRLWFYTTIPMLCLLLLLNTFIQFYYSSFSRRRSITAAQNETTYVASVLADSYRDLCRRFVRLTASSDAANAFLSMIRASDTQYTHVNNDMQTLIAQYTDISPLIDSVALIVPNRSRKTPRIFYSYSNRMRSEAFSFSASLSDTSGLLTLPACPSLFSGHGDVIPVIAPLSVIDQGVDSRITFSPSPSEASIYCCLFLGEETIRNYLELYCNDELEGSIFLADQSGTLLTPPDSKMAYSNSLSQTLQETLRTDCSYAFLQDIHIFLKPVKKTGLCLINAIPEHQFARSANSLSDLLLIIAIFGMIIITILSLMISLFITAPLKKLMCSVHAIKNGQYTHKALISETDEIGQLNDAIDSMYHTIQGQIEVIRMKEQEKYEAYLQLLTEQVNPHFLYNALEFINMEVIIGHTETASAMISSLGEYLHISLACGENELPFSQELEHVKAYINIMNFRFNQNIRLTVTIPEQLQSLKIIKCIFQPLAENSLKHGFKIGSSNTFPVSPMIDIDISLNHDFLSLSITDNGMGFDIEHTCAILEGKTDIDEPSHFGLRNIYERFRTAYGSAQVQFSSTPFFYNQIQFLIPAEKFMESQTTLSLKQVV